MKNNEKNVETNLILQKIKEVYEIMCNANIEEFKINIENFDLRIKRFSQKKENYIPPQKEFVLDNVLEKKSLPQEELKGEEIISPINGVFYRSPSPGAPPFVNEGDIVSQGSTLCIVEAMKVMNEIKADKKCKILKILCENGSIVTSATKLFLVEPV
ncbi:MAG: acetyl-CoA carboxylase biotin carboxyl carrier protein [Endomicrobiia bacterium]